MLLNYYKDNRTVRRMRQCLLGEYMDELAQIFYDQGYSKESATGYLRTAAHWARYAVWNGITDISQMNEAAATDFLENHLPNCSCERMNCGKYADSAAGIRHIIKFLLEKNVIVKIPEPIQNHDAISVTLQLYDEYLNQLFGLSQKTRNMHRRKAMLFMKWLTERHGHLELSKLCHEDITAYQTACDEGGYSIDWKQTLTSCLRGFLRFLRWHRIVTEDLTPSVYAVREWSLASLPKYMPFEDVKRLLMAPDRNTVTGKRDLAMMMLMAHLGFRASEVINLRIDDVDFRTGQITIRKTKARKERVQTLTIEIAEILIDYLKHRRGDLKQRQVFLKTTAPYTPLLSPSAAGSMVSKYINQTGVKTPTHGTHQFRHSLATHLINNGVPIKEISDLLGHSSIQTTTIYAKVQVERLKDVALPFPGAAMERRCFA